MSHRRLADATRRAARLQSAAEDPDRYLRYRAKLALLRAAGFWRLWRSFWR